MAILFRKEDKKWGCFSNFFLAPIVIDGYEYKTTEHYYQSMKASNIEDHEFIASAETPKEARERGRSCKIRENWEEIKENVMRIALSTKFYQHPQLKEILIESGSEKLIEWAPWDNYWGNGPTGNGENRLGVLLMEIRDDII